MVLFISILFPLAAVRAENEFLEQASRKLEHALNLNPFLLLEIDRPELTSFYSARGFRPIWFDDKGRLARADELIDILGHAELEGLNSKAYFLDDIRKYAAAADLDEAVRLEMWLSAALYRYAHDRYSGWLGHTGSDPDWHIPNSVLDSRQLFSDVADNASITDILSRLSPLQQPYRRLREQLQRYRDIAAQGGWGKIWTPMKQGEHPVDIHKLRQRLQLEGDLVAGQPGDEAYFDAALAQAVKRYQRRHGLEASGVVDNPTLHSFNISVEDRIAQIKVNMERWRWLPRDLGHRYVAVNMTGFELAVMDGGEVELTMPVIIGEPFRETPAISGVISTFVYNPYWTISKNIMWDTFIPGQIRDPDYLTKRSIHVFRGWAEPVEVDPKTVDWSALDPETNSPYWMRQDPGPGNALGSMKFLFSNPFHIYLHGTPAKHLFERSVRTLSHGCIRVKDPATLAAALLGDNSAQMKAEIDSKIRSRANEKVYLPVSVPIYLMYWTAWIGEDGVLNFRDDIYSRNAMLRTKLEQI